MTMNASSFFDQFALYWVGGFILIYTLAHLFVFKHSRFESLSEAHKKIAVKGLAISCFTVAYLAVKLAGR
jgi:predicted DNA repair protein MutK